MKSEKLSSPTCDRDCFNCKLPDCTCNETPRDTVRPLRAHTDLSGMDAEQRAAHRREVNRAYRERNRETLWEKDRARYRAKAEYYRQKARERYQARRAGEAKA